MERYRSVPFKLLGKYYLKELDGKELSAAFQGAFEEVEEALTEKELIEIIKEKGCTYFKNSENSFQWRAILVKSYLG